MFDKTEAINKLIGVFSFSYNNLGIFQQTEETNKALFNLISLLKESYDNLGIKDKNFFEFLEYPLGYLSELATIMVLKSDIPYIYSPKDFEKNIYTRFFYENYNDEIFGSIEDFDAYRLGFESAKVALTLGKDEEENIHFSFNNQLVQNYFHASNQCELVNTRIKSMANRIINNLETTMKTDMVSDMPEI